MPRNLYEPVPGRSARPEPSFLFSCAHPSRSTDGRKVPGRIAGDLHDFCNQRGSPDRRLLVALLSEYARRLSVSQSWPRACSDLSGSDGARVCGVWSILPGRGNDVPESDSAGPVEVQKPKAPDRAALVAGERIRFTSAILPKWARRTKSLDALLPVLYLRGISAGDFQEALAALLGKEAPN